MSIVTQFTEVNKDITLYTVYQAKDSATYTAITGGTEKLPANSIVVAVPSSGTPSAKLVGTESVTWANATTLGVDVTTVSNALKTKPAIVALSGSSTAADIVTALKS